MYMVLGRVIQNPGHWYVFTCRPDFSCKRQCDLVPRSTFLNTTFLVPTKRCGYGYGNQASCLLLHNLDNTIYVLPIYLLPSLCKLYLDLSNLSNIKVLAPTNISNE